MIKKYVSSNFFLSIIRQLVLFDSQFLSGYLDLIVPNDFPAQRRSQDGFPSFPLVFEHALLEPITYISDLEIRSEAVPEPLAGFSAGLGGF